MPLSYPADYLPAFIRLVDDSSEFIGMCGLDFAPLYVNPAGLRMVGLGSLAEARAARLHELFLPQDRPRLFQAFFPSVAEKGSGEIEVRLRHFRTGETRWMACKVIALDDAAGRRIAYGSVGQDITERRSNDRLELRPGRAELGAVLRHAAQSCAPLAQRAGHWVRTVLPDEPIHLDADGARLAQVFGNLLNNACKYTRPGGKISLYAERHGGEAVVTVEDNGIGIAPGRLARLFEGGLGLGLPLVKRLVEMHGGRIEASSAGEGLGSRFVVRLPIGTVALGRKG